MNRRIGIVMSKVYEDSNRQQLGGILDEALCRGFSAWVFTLTGESDRTELDTARELLANAVRHSLLDGILFLPYTFISQEFRDDLQRFLQELCTIPVVRIGTEKTAFPTVWYNDRAEMAEITEHLINVHGCRRLLCLTGPTNLQVSYERSDGFQDALQAAGLSSENAVIFGDFWVNAARELAQEIASGIREKPDAVVCASDTMAISLCDALTERGISVPDDILITGYDGTMESELHAPPITTYRTSWRKLGREAFCVLYTQITGSRTSVRFQTHGTLLCRESCGCQSVIYRSENMHVRERRLEDQYLDANLAARLLSCTELHPLVQTMYNMQHVFTDPESADRTQYRLCLFRDWESCTECTPEVLETDYNGRHVPFPFAEMLPPGIRTLAESETVFFVPLHFQEQRFGYTVLRMTDHADGYSTQYLRFCRVVGNALEMLRIRNQVNGLSVQQHARDLLTGLYQLAHLPHIREDYVRHLTKGQHFRVAFLITGMQENSRLPERFAELLRNACSHGELCLYAGGGAFVILGNEPDASHYHTLLVQGIREQFAELLSADGVELRYAVQSGEPLPADAKAEMQAAVSLLEQARSEEPVCKEQLHYADLEALRRRIYQFPEQDWSLAICSEQLSISSSYFHRIYQNAFGVSCAYDIRRSKLEHAKYLLLHTSDTLQEIARKCGYDYSHFMRTFRKECGMTPTAFRHGKT